MQAPHAAQHPLLHLCYILLLALLCAACQSSTPETKPAAPHSVWGNIITIAQSEQSSAPALWADPYRLVAAWVGADETGVHHDVRQWANGGLSPVTVLPLPPVHPYAQRWLPATGGYLHLFWLDAGTEGETQVFSALITTQFTVERGPTPVSEMLALHYTAISDRAGYAWAAWSGGSLSESILYLRSVDEAGRPQTSQQIAVDADYPALARSNDGTLLLFWLQNGQLMRSVITNGIVSAPAALTSAVYLDSGDRLHSLNTGIDQTHAYVFWNITRASGANETWFAAGEITADVWAQPTPLTFDVLPDSMFETGFNSGTASTASDGETPLVWTRPLVGQYDVLPAAVQSPNGLGIIYFQNGGVTGYQEIVTGVTLMGEPAFVGDRDRHLYLAWSQAATNTADLLLTSTRP